MDGINAQGEGFFYERDFSFALFSIYFFAIECANGAIRKTHFGVYPPNTRDRLGPSLIERQNGDRERDGRKRTRIFPLGPRPLSKWRRRHQRIQKLS